jgi:selenocysteine lyase/cysteine desulfurase
VLTPPLPRDAFALDPGLVYLNHAAVGVLPVRTRDALHAFVDGHARRGVLGVYMHENDLPRYRAAAGALIGARGEEIAFLRNTGDGATIVARGLDLGPGDVIVTGRNEFGSNAYPWLALGENGAHVRFVNAPQERMTPAVLAAQMDSRVKVVAVSWVTFDDGYRHDLAGLAEVAHAHGAIFAVDAIQALGAVPLDVNACGVDVLYAGGAKWLMALQGVSLLYVRADLLDRIATRLAGWRSVADIWDFLTYDQPWAPNASRYEGGTPNLAGALALATSIDVLRSANIDAIGAHILALTDRLVDGLAAKGMIVDSPRGPGVSSGIVRFRPAVGDPLELGRVLARADIVTTNRPTGIRVAPHGYNTTGEIDALLDLLSNT